MDLVQGKFLKINLSKNEIKEEIIDGNLYKKFFSGSGIAAYMLNKEKAYKFSPYSSEVPLLVIPGLLTGIPVPSACKTSICSKSPLTNTFCDSTVGGYFGVELKRAGYDGISITGKAKKPVYISINNDEVEIKSAENIWGKDICVTSKLLKEETDSKSILMCIGIAGENLVKISGIAVIKEYNEMRAAARGGLGAVMGAKKLKAIVVRGTGQIKFANKAKLIKSIKNDIPGIKENTAAFSEFGTAGSVIGAEKSGDLPIKNWQGMSWKEEAMKVSGQSMAEKIFVKHHSCFACPIRCAKSVKIMSGPFQGEETEQPEYETIAGLGAMLLNDDLDTLIEASDLCNRLGLDTMSTGGVIAFAMEAYEDGLITKNDTGGIELNWGSREAILDLIHKIAEKEGIGAILSEGTKNAASSIGGISREFAIHVKGMEVAFHDPRLWATMALNYAVANRGGCHLESFGYLFEAERFNIPPLWSNSTGTWEENIKYSIKQQNFMDALNALGICKFLLLGGIGLEQITNWLNLAANWKLNVEELLSVGNRIYNIKRIFNNEAGFSRIDDVLPPRLLTFGRKEGSAAEKNPQLDKMIEKYYQLRGWDSFGRPKIDKL